VQEGIYDAFVKKSVELAKKSVVGDPFNPNVHQGPQVMTMNENDLPI
jgi:coniferyl-aldehyde dehydrogenase